MAVGLMEIVRTKRRRLLTLLALAIMVFVPSSIGFGTKFYELFVLSKSNAEGGFALIPLSNYMLATCGFLCLLVWATYNGMFRNIEQPKFDFYEREKRLDEQYSTAMPEEKQRHG